MNRYRAIVWLYLAEELRQFAADEKHAPLMKGRTPEGLRGQLEEGVDLRPRNWRGRHLGFQLRQSEDPWARAAVVASLLDPVQVAEIVRDPDERAYLNRLRPARVSGATPDSPSTLIAERVMTAADPDEIGWLRADLLQTLAEAREDRPVPRPTPPSARSMPAAPQDRPPAPARTNDIIGAPDTARARRLLGFLRRRNADAGLSTAP